MAKTIFEKLYNYIVCENGCWNWQGGKNQKGYGSVWHNGKTMKATRVIWSVYFGEIPDGLYVLHTCDNPGCINPQHLFTGTNIDNLTDMVNKGRSCRGEKQHLSKLTASDVLKIKHMIASGLLQKDIADMFSVSEPCINSINVGRTWKHI